MHKNFRKTLLIALSPVAIIFLNSGCSSIIDARKQKQPYMASYYSGNVKQAAADLTVKSEDRVGTGDELMWRLDEGTADFTASEYKKSIEAFKKCEKLIENYDERAVINAREAGSEGGSAVTNPNALPYRGMYLDKIMLNAYKALDYFALNDPSGAQVELRRMREAQKQVVKQFDDEIQTSQKEIDAQNIKNQRKSKALGGQNAAIPFSTIVKNPIVNEAYTSSGNKANKLYGNLINPFVSYFSGIGYLIENNYGEALVDFRNLYKMNPNNKLIQRDYVTCAKNIGNKIPEELQKIKPFGYPLNSKIVFVLLFNGRAPALKQMRFKIILPYLGYTGIAFPTYEYFPVSLPGLEVDYTFDKKEKSAKTEQIADFDSIMSQEYHNKLPSMITRLVISTLTKEIASYAAVRAAKQAGTGAEIGAYALTGLYKYLFNTADTRCWETLPKEIQVTHLPIPDNGILRISPVGPGNKSSKKKEKGKHKKKSQITHYKKTTEIVLKKDTNVAIVYIRALSSDKLVYKLFEIN
jgi:uncharacterized protein